MPIPNKRKKENSDAFIKRCMSDTTMVREYPNEKQRYAICKSRI